MANFSFKKNNAHSTLLSSHTSGSGTIVVQAGDQSKFPSTFPFRITVYRSTQDQSTGTIFKVNSASSNTFNVTVASDESPTSADQNFTITGGAVFNVENDFTYGDTQEYEVAILTGWNLVLDSWTFLSYDSTNKTGVVTVPSNAALEYSVGMKGQFTNNSSVQKFFITNVATTTLTLYFGTSFSLTNSAITGIYYSTQKAPLGFPLNPDSWTVVVEETSDVFQTTPSNGTWYNVGSFSITVPVGVWKVGYQGSMGFGAPTGSGTATGTVYSTLSTTNNGESDHDMTNFLEIANVTLNSGALYAPTSREKIYNFSSATNLYLNLKSTTSSMASITLIGTEGASVIKAVIAYL